jgi:putative ABC transport system permease protein
MVVGRGALVALIGVSIGVTAAVVLTRFLTSLLFGVQAIDVITFVGTSAIMLAVALVAAYVPARRASTVDPVQALRTE